MNASYFRTNGNHNFLKDSYIPTLDEMTKEDTYLNFSLFQ